MIFFFKGKRVISGLVFFNGKRNHSFQFHPLATYHLYTVVHNLLKILKYLADLSYKQIENSDNREMTDVYVVNDALKTIASKDV